MFIPLFRDKLLILIAATLIICSCSKNEVNPSVTDPVLEISVSKIEFDRIGTTKTIEITTNQSPVSCESGVSWCTATYADGVITVETNTNQQSDQRAAIVSVKAGELKKSFSVSQSGLNSYQGAIKNDIKITVSSAATSSFQPGANIERSFDGDYSTIYHSQWDNSAENYFPITLSYHFSDVASMDYFVYYPRQSGSNGYIKEFELWVATDTNPNLTKYGDYNFNGSPSSSQVSFSPALEKPTTIQLVVKSGAGDRQGFVSCAEMEFYQKNPDNFDFLSVFTDNSCSELKSGITESDVMAISNNFFKDLALEIYRNEYNREFRIQNYKSWQNPSIMSKINKTNPYSLRDNPTGIYVSTGDELVFFANNPNNENVAILIQDLEDGFGGSSYPVSNGLNKIDITSGGLIYVMYYTAKGTEDPIKINFATGSINGYFDSQKHKKEDWSRILNNAKYKHFDAIGEFAHLTFPTEKFKQNTPDGLALINKFDDLVHLEWEFMGLYKYNKTFKNHMYFHVVYTDSYMYATSYRTAYAIGTMDYMTSLDEFTVKPWGPAHEVGHCNQTRPGLKWIGMTEVTNNIHSLYVQTSWGNTSRLITGNKYTNGFNEVLNKGIPHNQINDVFVKLVPFWQLKLYLMDVLGKSDFYKDLYEYMRNQDNSQATNDGFYQLDFVRATCRIANLDLTAFFEAWGFLTPVDITVNDYATKQFTITQQQIDELKAEIAAKNYPQPAHNNIYSITDNNVSNYK